MTYLPTLSAQTQYFAYSIFLGLAIGLIYDFMRLLREAVFWGRKPRFFMSDVLVFILTAFLFELFTITYGYGKIRYYALLGMLLGFILYINTVGSITWKFENKLAKLLHKLLLIFVVNPVFILYNGFVKLLRRIFHRKKDNDDEGEEADESEEFKESEESEEEE